MGGGSGNGGGGSGNGGDGSGMSGGGSGGGEEGRSGFVTFVFSCCLFGQISGKMLWKAGNEEAKDQAEEEVEEES